MNESFQIIATLAAVQLALAMSPGPAVRFVARAAMSEPGRGRVAALGLWFGALVWSALALAVLDSADSIAPGITPVLRLVCGLYVLHLAIAAVRNAFADHHAGVLVPVTTSDRSEIFRLALRGTLASPSTLAFHAAVLGLTGAVGLDDNSRIVAVLAMPTVAFAWNLLVATTSGGDRPLSDRTLVA